MVELDWRHQSKAASLKKIKGNTKVGWDSVLHIQSPNVGNEINSSRP